MAGRRDAAGLRNRSVGTEGKGLRAFLQSRARLEGGPLHSVGKSPVLAIRKRLPPPKQMFCKRRGLRPADEWAPPQPLKPSFAAPDPLLHRWLEIVQGIVNSICCAPAAVVAPRPAPTLLPNRSDRQLAAASWKDVREDAVSETQVPCASKERFHCCESSRTALVAPPPLGAVGSVPTSVVALAGGSIASDPLHESRERTVGRHWCSSKAAGSDSAAVDRRADRSRKQIEGRRRSRSRCTVEGRERCQVAEDLVSEERLDDCAPAAI